MVRHELLQRQQRLAPQWPDAELERLVLGSADRARELQLPRHGLGLRRRRRGALDGPKPSREQTAVQPGIGGVQAHARAADKGFAACVQGAPGTPAQCKALGAAMRAAAANPSLQPLALAQIDKLQSLAADRIAKGYVAEGSLASFKIIVNPLAPADCISPQ